MNTGQVHNDIKNHIWFYRVFLPAPAGFLLVRPAVGDLKATFFNPFQDNRHRHLSLKSFLSDIG